MAAEDRASTRMDSPDHQLAADTSLADAEREQTALEAAAPAEASADGATTAEAGLHARSADEVTGADSSPFAAALQSFQAASAPITNAEDQPLPRPGYEQPFLKSRDEAAKGSLRYLKAQGVKTAINPDGSEVIDTHPDGAPRWQPQSSAPFQGQDGQWYMRSRNDRGDVQDVDLRSTRGVIHTDPHTGEQYFLNESKQPVSVGVDPDVARRVADIANRRRLRSEEAQAEIQVQSVQASMQEPKAMLVSLRKLAVSDPGDFSSPDLPENTTVGNLENRVKSLGLAVNAGNVTPEVQQQLTEAQNALAAWKTKNPGYETLRGVVESGDQKVRDLREGIRQSRLQVLGAGAGTGEPGDAGPGDVAQQAQDIATQNGVAGSAVLPRVLARARAAGITTIGGRPISDVLAESLQPRPPVEPPKPAAQNPEEPGWVRNFIGSALNNFNQYLAGQSKVIGRAEQSGGASSSDPDAQKQEQQWQTELQTGQYSPDNPYRPGGEKAGLSVGFDPAGLLHGRPIVHPTLGANWVSPNRQKDIMTGVAHVLPDLAAMLLPPGSREAAFGAKAFFEGASKAEDEGKSMWAGGAEEVGKTALTLALFHGSGKLAHLLVPELANPLKRFAASAFTAGSLNSLVDVATNYIFGGNVVPKTPAEAAQRILFTWGFGALHGYHEAMDLPKQLTVRQVQNGLLEKQQADIASGAVLPDAAPEEKAVLLKSMAKIQGNNQKELDRYPKLVAAINKKVNATADVPAAADAPADFGGDYQAKQTELEQLRQQREAVAGDPVKLVDLDQAIYDREGELHAMGKTAREQLPDEVRGGIAQTLKANGGDESRLNDQETANMAAGVGRSVRGDYLHPDTEAAANEVAAKAGVAEPVAQHLIDQHVGLLAGRDLEGVLRGQGIPENRAATLEAHGLLERVASPEGGEAYHVTPDGLRLVSRGAREAAQRAPVGSMRAIAGTHGEPARSLARQGQRYLGEALRSNRQPVSETTHQVRVKVRNAAGEEVERVVPVRAASEEQAVAKATARLHGGGREVTSAETGATSEPEPTSPERKLAVSATQEAFAERKELFSALGVKKLVFEPSKRGGLGIHTTLDGTVKADVARLAEHAGDEVDFRRLINTAMDEEFLHVAQIASAKRTHGGQFRKLYADIWGDEQMPQGLKDAVHNLFDGADKMEEWQKGAEAVRMVLQGRWKGTITELVFRRIKEVLDYLRGLPVEGNDLLSRTIRDVEEIVRAAEKGEAPPDAGSGDAVSLSAGRPLPREQEGGDYEAMARERNRELKPTPEVAPTDNDRLDIRKAYEQVVVENGYAAVPIADVLEKAGFTKADMDRGRGMVMSMFHNGEITSLPTGDWSISGPRERAWSVTLLSRPTEMHRRDYGIMMRMPHGVDIVRQAYGEDAGSLGAGRLKKFFKIPYAPSGTPDAVDAMVAQGGIHLPAEEQRADALFGDMPDLKSMPSLYRELVGNGNALSPDDMATAMAEAHLIPAADVGLMWQEFAKAVRFRAETMKGVREREKALTAEQRMITAQNERFAKDAEQPGEKKQAVGVDSLAVGDKMEVRGETLTVTHIDPDTLERVLEGGAKYGTQSVKEGETLHVDKVTKAKEPSFEEQMDPEGFAKKTAAAKAQREADKVKVAIEKETGIRQPAAEKVEVNPAAEMKRDLRAQEKAGEAGVKRGAVEARAEAKERLGLAREAFDAAMREQKETLAMTDRWGSAEWRKAMDGLRSYAQKSLPRDARASALELITRLQRPDLLSKDPDRIHRDAFKIMQRIDGIADEHYKQQLIDDIKETAQRAADSPGVDINYKARISALKQRYAFVKLSEGKRAELESRRRFLRQADLAGNPSGLTPEALQELRRLDVPHISELPIDAIEALRDKLNLLETQGRLVVASRARLYQAELAARKADLDKTKATPWNNRQENADLPSADPSGKTQSTLRSRFGNALTRAYNQGVKTVNALMPIDAAFDMLGEAKGTYDGWLFRSLRGPIDLGYNLTFRKLHAVSESLESIIKKHKLTQENGRRIGVHAAAEQEGGRERLIKQGIPAELIDKIQASLSPGEKAAYDYMRQTMDAEYKPLRELMRALYNQDVVAEKNYFPLVRDWSDFKAQQEDLPKVEQKSGEPVSFDELSTWKNIVQDVQPRHRTRTEQGFTKERTTGAATPVRIEAFDVFRRHMRDVLHLQHTQRELKLAGEIVRSKEFAAKYGKMGREVVNDWLDTVARNGGVESWKRIQMLDELRRRSSVGMVAFRAVSMLKHISNAALAVHHVGAGWYAKGLSHVFTPEAEKFLRRNMAETYAREGGEQAIEEVTSQSRIAGLGFLPIRQIDRVNAQATALGVYFHQMAAAGFTPEQALAVDLHARPAAPVGQRQKGSALEETARQAVQDALVRMRRVVASPNPKDAPQALSRGTGIGGNVSWARTLFQFGNIFLDRFSNVRHDLIGAGIRKRNFGQANTMAIGLLGAIAAEAGITLGMRSFWNGVTGNHPDDKDDPTYAHEFLEHAAKQFPFMGQLMTSWSRGETGIPTLDAPVAAVQEITRAKNAASTSVMAKHIVRGVGGALAVSGVPGAGQVSDVVAKKIGAKDQSPIKKIMHDAGIERPKEGQDYSEQRKELLGQLRGKKITAQQAFDGGVKIGMTREAAARMVHESRKEPSLVEFERLPYPTALAVFQKAAPEQKKLWVRALAQKRARQHVAASGSGG